MKTLNQHLKNYLMLVMVGLFTLSATAQKTTDNDMAPILLDTVSVISNTHSLEKMVSKIVFNEQFKYRKVLKKAKVSQKQYVFSSESISEVQILKHFKKAARKSESVTQFINYFNDRHLPILITLDEPIIAGLYDSMRQTTLNGYLDELGAMVGTNY